MKPLAFVLALFAAASVSSFAADYPPHVLGNTQVRELLRSANGRDYQLFIALPPGYATDTGKRYPVVYICDGYWDFVLYNGLYGNLIYDQVAPHFIIVGLGYKGTHTNAEYDVLRRYDYTSAPDGNDRKRERSGHADEFLDVIEHEIVPLMEKEYRADPSFRVLGGNSLGGFFSLYAMFARPGLFQAHIAASPAASPALFEAADKFAASGKKLTARVFMSGAAAENPQFLANIQRFNERLQKFKSDTFAYQWRLVEGEGHTGTKPESYNRGLRWAFVPLAPKR